MVRLQQRIRIMQVDRFGAGVLAISGFLSKDECKRFISLSEETGYEEASVHTDAGERVFREARNNDRIIFDDPSLAHRLYQRALPYLPSVVDGWQPSGFNERMRYYRYEQQQQFTWHQDGTYRRTEREESFLTFLMYLNENFKGGETAFGWDSIRPKQGMAVVFPHRLRHMGAAVTEGVKYVLRTDVMYARPLSPRTE
ncbi:2OG-Fe(II) oxygenase [Caldimonas mangrovi]|uniref:2OG-Fe(II) oxygenase n=1 Tax=Caldimonas mangrovi TaxID=2944811 RepID=UPI002043444C